MKLETRILLLSAAMFLGLACLSAGSMVLHYLLGFDIPVWVVKLLDVGGEGNLWTWANVVVLAIAALAGVLTGYFRSRSGGHAAGWFLAAAMLTAFSLDDFIALHEKAEPIGRALGGGDGLTYFAWVLPGAGLALLSIAFFLPLLLKTDPAPRRLARWATLAFFGGALGLESLSGWYLSFEPQSASRLVYYGALMHIEELLEAAGAALYLAAGIADLRIQRGDIARILAPPATQLSGEASPPEK